MNIVFGEREDGSFVHERTVFTGAELSDTAALRRYDVDSTNGMPDMASNAIDDMGKGIQVFIDRGDQHVDSGRVVGFRFSLNGHFFSSLRVGFHFVHGMCA